MCEGNAALELRKAARRGEVKQLEADKRARFLRRAEAGGAVVIDLAFAAQLDAREHKSLRQQLLLCHGANRRAPCPRSLHLAGVDGAVAAELRSTLEGAGYPERWAGVTVHAAPLEALGPFKAPPPLRAGEGRMEQRMVYLTADSDTVLRDVRRDRVYVLGGIVDRNRLKGATLARAGALGISTARLPLREEGLGAGAAGGAGAGSGSGSGSSIVSGTQHLALSHVFEILLQFQHCRDWGQAFRTVLPARKVRPAHSHTPGGSEGRG